MSEVHQLSEDLAYVRGAVQRRERRRPDMLLVYLPWAVYVLIGYALIDYRWQWANLFFAVAWIPAAFAGVVAMRRMKALGEIGSDREMGRRAALHWGGGIFLAVATSIGLSKVIPGLDHGPAGGQLGVCLIGMVYFLGGVHFDRRLIVLGPVMIAGGICIGFMPVLPWTTLGVVIALGLILPSFFKRTPHVEA